MQSALPSSEYNLFNYTMYEVAEACPELQTISCHFWRAPRNFYDSPEPSAGYYK